MDKLQRLKLVVPVGSFGAYLFDCDGTIADSMPLHYIAWTKALAEWGCVLDEQLFYAWGGTPVAEIVGLLNQKQGLRMPVERVSSRKEKLYLELLPQLTAVPEVVEHILDQHGCGFREYSRVSESVAYVARAAGEIRNAGVRWGLCEEQARSRSVSAGGIETGSCARNVFGLRRY
jgi:beta-phosphoglucomutase-like phosphatase (HAD superfamily)